MNATLEKPRFTCAPFEPVPDKDFPDGTKGGTYFGVRLPRSVHFYDCRSDLIGPFPKAHYGETLYSAERAAYVHGLRKDYWDNRFDMTPVSLSGIHDTREPANAAETARNIIRMRELLAEHWRRWRRGSRKRRGLTPVFLPVLIAVSNFGMSLVADEREMRYD